MSLDRCTLAKIDRKVFAELGHTVATQTVKVPLSDAMWSTWRRYCEAIGLTMGEGVAGLIDYELRTVVDEAADEGFPVFAGRVEDLLAVRESKVAAREGELKAAEERMRMKEEELRALEQRTRVATSLALRPVEANRKVGRNERCPCGSGLKYKLCHGLADR
jgi:preprotein translocase subunit SecA